jgi:hypothetical protein
MERRLPSSMFIYENDHKNITNLKVITSENKYRNWNKANNSKEKAKTGLFGYDSVPELNTKNLGNSPSFVSVTLMAMSA